MKAAGWKPYGAAPSMSKCVITGAPHTSNWDGVLIVVFSFAFGIEMFWLGKQTLFRWPFGGLVRWLGGIPVERRKSTNLVEQTAQMFRDAKTLHLVIAPEGTRKKAERWKTGFYYMALQANIPIVLGVLDYKRRLGGFGITINPSGNIEADMELIRDFYADITGKNPDQFTIPRV